MATRRSRTNVIELDITQRCNLMCNNCTRRCDLFKGLGHDIDKKGISQFIQDSLDCNHQWARIFVMGGEPTLHPQYRQIMEMLDQHVKNYDPSCQVILVSNCLTLDSRKKLDQLESSGFLVRRSPKTTPDNKFWTVNVAPIDFEEFAGVDFGVGCSQQVKCGLHRSVNGLYYGCSIAGGIDEVFDLGTGTYFLQEVLNPIGRRNQFVKTCGYCGRFRLRYLVRPNGKCREADFFDPSLRKLFIEHCLEYPLYSGERVLSKSWKEKFPE